MKATLESKTRTVARVFHDAQLNPQDVIDVLLPLLPDSKLTLIMDRTTWHYGQTPLNILVLGAILGGAVIPLVWSILPHQGDSCTAARILLVARLLKVLPARRWAVSIADRVIVASDLPVFDVLETYRRRWGIETAFSSLKSRGLNLEATHMTASERISRLFGLLCVALAWMVRVGAQTAQESPPRQDNRGRAVVSQVRIGWQVLSQAVRWGGEAFWVYFELLNNRVLQWDARRVPGPASSQQSSG